MKAKTLFPIFLLFFLFGSCTIEKRIFNKGYYIHRNGSELTTQRQERYSQHHDKVKNTDEPTIVAFDTVTDQPLSHLFGDTAIFNSRRSVQAPVHVNEPTISQHELGQVKEPFIPSGKTKADHDAELAVVFLLCTFLISFIGLILATVFALRAIRENGKTEAFSPEADRKANLVLNIVEVFMLIIIAFIALLFYVLNGI